MPITKTNAINPGTLVNIIQKADQRTSQTTRGRVAELLTRGNHPRGVKVKLSDGRVGRVDSFVEGFGGGGGVPSAGSGAGGVGGAGAGGVGEGAGGSVDASAVSAGSEMDAREADARGADGRGGMDVRGGAKREGLVRAVGGMRPPGVRRVYIQDDVRNDPAPAEERSLEDYVTFKPARGRGGKKSKAAKAPLAGVTEEHGGGGGGGGEGARARGTGQTGQTGQAKGDEEAQVTLQEEFPTLDAALVAAILGDSSDGIEGARRTLRALS